MARPKLNQEKILEIYRLRGQGKSIDAIMDALLYDIARGTVAKYTKQYDNFSDSLKRKDREFDWAALEEHGLPWEASEYLLRMWAFIKKRGNIPQIPDFVQSMVQTVTFRQAIWWWRVHLAAPDISFIDVYWLGQKFAFREQVEDAFDTPYEIADLQAFLAFRPWEGGEATRHYLDAINRGVITAVSSPDSSVDVAKSLADMGLDHPLVGAGGENGLLYSQLLDCWVQQNMEKIYMDVSNPNLFGALSGVHPSTPQLIIEDAEETK